MIQLLTGENSFEMERALKRATDAFSGHAERVQADTLAVRDMPDLLMGGTLFADSRMVIIRRLSEESSLWNWLGEHAQQVNDSISLILVEPKPDKRTKAYKAISKLAQVQEFALFGPRDKAKVEKWVGEEAHDRGISMDQKATRTLIERTGYNQWALHYALEKLAVVGNVSAEDVVQLIDGEPEENVFALFETALKGEGLAVQKMLSTIALTEDPYRLLGLLGGQAFQLAALYAAKDNADVTKDLGVHAFALSKLLPHKKTLTLEKTKAIIEAFAEADHAMKSSAIDPWLLLERALLKVARVENRK